MGSRERQLGVELFNRAWALIESRADDGLLVHMAHASAYHWAVAAECRPENRARSEWLVARVYALLGCAEPALRHASRCLAWCEEHGLEDWDRAFAYEALARASKIAGDDGAAADYVAKALAVPVEEADDRELLERDLASV